jgi:hypothetical protein
MKRIVRSCIGLDKLCSKRDTAPSAKKRHSYKRAARRHTKRIQNLVNEVHKQLAKHLATSYDLVMIPKFETSRMIGKATHETLGLGASGRWSAGRTIDSDNAFYSSADNTDARSRSSMNRGPARRAARAGPWTTF